MIPEFAIIGHPNEGKSSVLSTLAEDDSVRISPTPGETTECRTFPVLIDGQEVLRFTDTPGFQNPARVLSEMKKRRGSIDPLREFREFAATITDLHDDHELLGPVERGAGIIYVVDGSRPLRGVDRMEMEILRLTGKPRMAIINCKSGEEDHLQSWKSEFRKNFNSFRVFNAHNATYAERISLLEALKSIDQDWQEPLSKAVNAFKQDWLARNRRTAEIITQLIIDSLTLKVARTVGSTKAGSETRLQEELLRDYQQQLEKLEKKAHREIRTLFKHNIFNYDLPPQSILNEDLMADRTWQLLGMTQTQLIIAGGISGAVIGAGVDVAALGHGLGLFTAMGTVAGALGALFGGDKLTDKIQILGQPLGGEQIQIGPAKSIELMFVLLNRSLLFYQHVINWAHGRRDYDTQTQASGLFEKGQKALTADWSAANIKICDNLFKQAREGSDKVSGQQHIKFRELVEKSLEDLSHRNYY